ncbi:SDR family NAD(P)-dependent oxidoreductase [Sphingomonas montanisoli]|uniref:SDR family oxidoreductase n=1 Tax=Sphingomonas montanisoli TaxID=2606412 RepID=A0A5D9CCI2_9SPHN|nr:SDR family NAD(P)-dependent oxidoreductase [Sphingomonas montanisoli]TZG28730.1 SDR family oxidoreductase [Sphingomonas montanisoli]
MFRLDGKIALITGAGQNIGAGVAQLMAAQGAIVLVNDYYAERAQETVDGIVAAGGKARAVPFDVTDREAVNAAVAEIAANEGPVDILVNNAGNAGIGGNMGQKPFAETSPEVWPGIFAVNLYGLFHCCQAVLPSMIERQQGRIITNTSGAGQAGLNIGVSAYGAAKSGQIGFMRHLAVENARYNITCNTIAIGLVIAKPSPVTEPMAKSIPLKRLGKPEDIGALAVYLASDEAGWITGQTIGANGGAWIN